MILRKRSHGHSKTQASFLQFLFSHAQGRSTRRAAGIRAPSVAANYRAACRARSRAEFISKLGTVVEECDESVYWLEYLARTGMMFTGHADLLAEAQELRAIFAASYRTARANHKKRQK